MKNEKNANTPMTSNKNSIKKRIEEYMEKRREKNYANDEAFHKAITPDHNPSDEGENERVIYRNGVDTRFLVYVILLLCFGAVMSYVYAEQ